jgi:uncharacterized membrane protein
MRARIQLALYSLSGSYWFVPALMAISAIVLSQLTVQIDREHGATWMADWWWGSLNQPEGARALLATVAGSMMTVAGVTFSLTILAVSYATSHFGPRLLDNFMHDRGNQVTLGTFVATFLYCLLVLRTVRSPSRSFDPEVPDTVFVPHLSVFIAVALTLASVGVLIYFIHHIPESIYIANVLDRISNQIACKVDDLFPEMLAEPATCSPVDVDALTDGATPLRSQKSGYLQGLDETSLLEFATRHDATLRLLCRPGDFILSGQTIAMVVFGDNNDDGEDRAKQLLKSFAIGVSRTPTQDLYFLSNQLVEIAVRALSPGVNDPFTANQCIDQLSKMLNELSRRSFPSRFRKDERGNLRIITTEESWGDVVERSLGPIIPYARSDAIVTKHLERRIQQIIDTSRNEQLNALLRDLIPINPAHG